MSLMMMTIMHMLGIGKELVSDLNSFTQL